MKKFLYIVPLTILLAAGCGYSQEQSVQTQPEVAKNVQLAPPFPSLPKEPPQIAPIKKVSTVNWKTYTNTAYGISFQYPATWKLIQYTYSNEFGKGVIGIALDPIKVGTQKEFENLDTYMGTLQIYFGQGQPIGYDSFGDTTLGPNQTPAKYSLNPGIPTGPNPAWYNVTSESYYLNLPEKLQTKTVQTMELRLSYPNSRAKDSVFKNTLETIVSTFDIVN